MSGIFPAPRVLSRTWSWKARLHYLDRGGEAAGGGVEGGGGGGGKGAAFTCDAFYVYFRPGEKRGGRGERDQTHVRDMRFHLRPLIARLGVVPTTFKDVKENFSIQKLALSGLIVIQNLYWWK